MRDMKHTPGPWTAMGAVIWANGDSVSRHDAVVAQAVLCDEYEVNARLIAAAPDLLAALHTLWKMFEDGRIVRNISNDGKPDWALRMLTFTQELQTVQAAIDRAEAAHESGRPASLSRPRGRLLRPVCRWRA